MASANPNELYANDPPGNDLSEVQPIAALQMPSWQQIAASVPESIASPGPADFLKAAGSDCKRRRQAFHSMLVGRWTLAKAASALLHSSNVLADWRALELPPDRTEPGDRGTQKAD